MCAWDMQGFVEIYRGRENRHRQKNLAHATEYEFRLKASSSSTFRILTAQHSLKLSRGAHQRVEPRPHIRPCKEQMKEVESIGSR